MGAINGILMGVYAVVLVLMNRLNKAETGVFVGISISEGSVFPDYLVI